MYTAMSRPAPVEKMAEAAVPGVGAMTPFSFSAEPLRAASAGAEAPKSRATAAKSIVLSAAAGAASCGGATNTQVQYAACHASNKTSATTRSEPNAPVFGAGAAGD